MVPHSPCRGNTEIEGFLCTRESDSAVCIVTKIACSKSRENITTEYLVYFESYVNYLQRLNFLRVLASRVPFEDVIFESRRALFD